MSEKEQPVISIVIPCYNQGKYLPETLESIKDQTFKKWECILVNDGSTDNTKEIAQSWCIGDNRFIYIEQQNAGTSAAKNAGLLIARGKYIQVLDSDDLLMKDKLSAQLEAINQIDDPTIITYTAARYFYYNDRSKRSSFMYTNHHFLNQVEVTKEDPDQDRIVFLRNPMTICAPLYPKQMFNDIGLYDSSLSAMEDWDIHIRAVLAGYRFHYLNYDRSTLALIRVHAQSAMNNKKNFQVGQNILYNKHIKNDRHGIWEIKSSGFKIKRIIRNLLPPIIFKLVSK